MSPTIISRSSRPTGGAGDDTFAFVTAVAGITNSGFGSTDTIVGGEGTDTIQIGLNGVGTYTLNTSEFSNKTGIDVLDLRGNNNDVRVSSQFVAAADADKKLIIRTDKIVQTTLENTANPTGASAAEDNSTSIINLTDLTLDQGIKVIGGSGSERVVANNASLNAQTEIDLGTNGGVAGRYDTLTVLDSAVIDSGDLRNVKGVEALILAETVVGNSTFRIDLTEAFLLNNTAATNDVTTSINDTVFRIGSAASSTGIALGAGDVVTIDISGLLNSTRTALATSLVGRGIDVAFAAGVTVNYVVDGGAASAAQVAMVTIADPLRADAGVGSAAGAVVVPPAFTGTAAADTYTLLANADGVDMGAGSDTLNITNPAALAPTGTLDGGEGIDNLVLAAGANISGANVIGFETLTLGGAATMTVGQYNSFVNVVAAGAADVIVFTDAGTITTTALTGAAGVETYTLANGTNNVTLGGPATATRTITGGTGADTVNTTIADAFFTVFTAGAGTDTLNITDGVSAVATIGTGAAGAAAMQVTGLETLNIAGASTANMLTLVSAVAGDFATIDASGVTGGGISLTTTGLTAASDRTIILTDGNDTITDLQGTAGGTLTVDFGAGVTDTVTDLATANAGGLLTLKAAATAGSTHTITFAATTANLATGTATGTLIDFSGDVTAIVVRAIGAAGVNVAGQVIIDNTTVPANTSILWDADGDGVFSAGDIKIDLVGQAYNGGTAAIVGGDLQL